MQKSTRNPFYDAIFSFDVSEENISSYDVLFAIYHLGPLQRTRIGYVLVGVSANHSGYKQWKQCFVDETTETAHRILKHKPLGLMTSIEDSVLYS